VVKLAGSGKKILPVSRSHEPWSGLFSPLFTVFRSFSPIFAGLDACRPRGIRAAKQAPNTNNRMNTCDTIELEAMEVRKENIIHLPLGLLGFESFKKYVLLSEPEDAPFHWLQVIDDPRLAFLVLSPFEVVPNYELNLSEEDSAFLKLSSPEDVLVYNIVTLHRGGLATINLRGPIVLNRFTLRGKQVVLTNATSYSLHHPLPAVE
jgi:flagellar assembly factor FliW